MAIKDLLIDFTGSPACRQALELAVMLAEKHGAALTGIQVKDVELYEGKVRRFMGEEVLAVIKRTQDEAVAAIEADFWAGIGGRLQPPQVEWVVAEGRPDSVLAKYVRYHDLLILGRERERTPTSTVLAHANDIVIRGGKPLLLVPEEWRDRPFRDHAVVAWDGSRASARALSDAMQILEANRSLDILTIGDPARPLNEARSIVRHLARHGVAANRVYRPTAAGGVAGTILSHCQEVDADMLVIGARAHARLRDVVLGGTVSKVLETATLPVMISH